VREEAARAAYALGVFAAHCRDYELAEKHQQQALRLLPREPSELLGRVHAALAIAFFRLGKSPEGEAHREIACAMRMVSADSYPAERQRSSALPSHLPTARKSRMDGWQS
jgi:tetratricopeptide (TPR) repeat protein